MLFIHFLFCGFVTKSDPDFEASCLKSIEALNFLMDEIRKRKFYLQTEHKENLLFGIATFYESEIT